METLFSFVSILLASLFPGFLVTAIRTQDKEKSEAVAPFFFSSLTSENEEKFQFCIIEA